ncbi:hypothetical protein BV898_14377 [Hypsibius exemplaris]|uniref:Uncharacterized protein n=1 Tax=Hypsibius exemplaris TaxID=2072580 RepID=A0A9X6NI54_HYPEX|nr:hypothetical protein BV898_14377 [Hypsibius exemplaris]
MTAGSVEMLIIGRFFAGVNSACASHRQCPSVVHRGPPFGFANSRLASILGTSELWPILLGLAQFRPFTKLVDLAHLSRQSKSTYISIDKTAKELNKQSKSCKEARM